MSEVQPSTRPDDPPPGVARLAEPPDHLPASAQAVHRLLATEGPLTHKELVELSDMPARTVRFAVARLKDEGLVGERGNLMDSRQSFFFLSRNGV